MEPNPIYRLELRQLRRGGFLYTMAGAGVLMSAFLIVMIRYGLEFDVGSPFYMAIPVMFYVLGIFGTPLVAGLRFAFQQVGGDLIYETPLSGKTIVLGKFRSAVFMVLCLYLPALPGVVYQTQHGEFRHLIGMAACAAFTTVLSAAMIGFAAGTKSTVGALGTILWTAIFTGFGYALCLMTAFGISHLLHELMIEPLSFLMNIAFACSALFWGSLAVTLPLRRGCVVMDKVQKPGRLIAMLLVLWLVTITVGVGALVFQTMLGPTMDGHQATGILFPIIFLASGFFFLCMPGELQNK